MVETEHEIYAACATHSNLKLNQPNTHSIIYTFPQL